MFFYLLLLLFVVAVVVSNEVCYTVYFPKGVVTAVFPRHYIHKISIVKFLLIVKAHCTLNTLVIIKLNKNTCCFVKGLLHLAEFSRLNSVATEFSEV